MNDADRELMDRLLDDDLSPAEQAALVKRIEAGGEGAAQLAERALLHAGLRHVLRREALQHATLATVGGFEARAEEKIIVMPQARFRRVVVAWAAAACLVVVAALVSVFMLTNASASPTAILRHALKAHSAVLDRCYRVEVKFEPGWRVERDGYRSAEPGETRLWTRGDRFWIESREGQHTLAWGRDEQGRVWLASSPELGASFEPDEVGERLALACDLRSLRLESLLHSILADFDLRREPGSHGGQLIHAALKTGHAHPLYRAALLEVDAESGVLRRVVLNRLHSGQAAAVVTLTLIETSLSDDASYTLGGHLVPQAVIYDRQHEPAKRAALFARLFGTLVSPAASQR
ncbi:MAG: hypothetical protein L0Z50_34365 [Verrucomicrobiales bacterium]|nr:hypothetical protein [Verrucomicrobiales bacterium]